VCLEQRFASTALSTAPAKVPKFPAVRTLYHCIANRLQITTDGVITTSVASRKPSVWTRTLPSSLSCLATMAGMMRQGGMLEGRVFK
jgi:hypothetical protein